jgi:hypothetical protein
MKRIAAIIAISLCAGCTDGCLDPFGDRARYKEEFVSARALCLSTAKADTGCHTATASKAVRYGRSRFIVEISGCGSLLQYRYVNKCGWSDCNPVCREVIP